MVDVATETLRSRMMLLEDANNKAWAARTELEARVSALERERAGSMGSFAAAFENIAARLSELGTSVKELPPADALHAALDQLQWLDGGPRALEELVMRLDGRLLMVEEHAQTAQKSLVAAEAAISKVAQSDDTKTPLDEHERWKKATIEKCCELRYLFESKTDSLNRFFHDALEENRLGLVPALEEKAERTEQVKLRESCSELKLLIERSEELRRKEQEDLAENQKKYCSEVVKSTSDSLSTLIDSKSADLMSMVENKIASHAKDRDCLAESLQRAISDQWSEIREAKADKRDYERLQDEHQRFVGEAGSKFEELKTAIKRNYEVLVSETGSNLRRDHEALSASVEELRSAVGSKVVELRTATKRDHEALAEALNQSCRDLSSSIMTSRQDLTVLEQNCRDLAQSVVQDRQHVGLLDQICREFKHVVKELERQHSRRIWGYVSPRIDTGIHRPHTPSRRKQQVVDNANPHAVEDGEELPPSPAPTAVPWRLLPGAGGGGLVASANPQTGQTSATGWVSALT